MQSMLTGRGSGGRTRTPASGTPVPSRDGLFELRPVLGEALDQAADQIVRAEMRDILHDGGDIDDSVAFEHAQLVVIEVQDLHCSLRRG